MSTIKSKLHTDRKGPHVTKKPNVKKKTAQEEVIEEKERELQRNISNPPTETEKAKVTNVPDEAALDDADQEPVDPV